MSLHPAMARSIEVFRSQAGELLDRARAETTEQVAQFTGRGASWVDEAGHVLADSAVSLADAAGAQAAHVADRLAEAVDRWSAGLGDRMVRLGAELAGSRRERD